MVNGTREGSGAMRLATVRTGDSVTAAARLDGETAVLLPATDLAHLMANPNWRSDAAAATGAEVSAANISFAAPITAPRKIVCVGLNYRAHIEEMGRELPSVPTLFAKYPEALVGPRDDILLPPESAAMDWEGELAVVIGSTVRRADPSAAREAIAGYTVLNDVTARDFQYRTSQWLQGKTFESTTPLGPVLVTTDEFDKDAAHITTIVDGEVVQHAPIADLVFGPVELVSYISTIVSLHPGDVIATGTPSGVGHGMSPKRYLGEGTRLTTRIDGIGELDNACRVG
jgi:acylpyruvate hydrolase